MTAPAAPAPVQLTHRQVLTVLSGLLLGMFLAALDQTIVSTAMRTIADELEGQTAQAWVTTSYLIASTITTPLYGKLSDQYGRKPFYLFAIGVFVLGSVLCGTAQSIYELAAYRAVQGLGAGGLMSLAFAIVGDLVSPRERGRYQGWFMAVFGTSSVLGPVIGGAFAGQDTILGIDGWRWIFYINVPIGLAALLVVMRTLHLPKRVNEHRIDFLGAGLLTSAVVPLLLVAEKGRDWGWGSGLTVGLLALSVVSLAGRLRAVGAADGPGGDPAAADVLQQHLQHHQRDGAAGRRGHVRRAGRAAALPADRQGLLAHRGRPAAHPAHGRHHRHLAASPGR